MTYTLADLTRHSTGSLKDAVLAEAARTFPVIDAMNTEMELRAIRETGMSIADARAHRALCDRLRFGRTDADDDYDPDQDTFECDECRRDTGPEVGPCPDHQPAAHYWDTHPNAPQGPAVIPPVTREPIIFHRAGSEPTA